MLFDSLALISLLIIVTLLKRLVNIFPSLMACIIRWKENFNLHQSVKMSTDRNMLSVALVIPFCLIADRFDMYHPAFMDGFNSVFSLLTTIGVFFAYIGLRIACRYVFQLHSTSKTTYKVANESARTYFITGTLLLLATGGLLSVFGTPMAGIKNAMFWLSGTIYTVFLLRKTQIFNSSCSLFATFLYLCALEFLPTGVLIASAVIF